MGALAQRTSGRARTIELIEAIAGGERGGQLRSQVAAWHPDSSRDDVDEAFQEACLIAQRACRGQFEGEVFTWLRTTTHRKLGQMEKAARRREQREILVDVEATQLPPSSTPAPEQELIDKEDDAEVTRVTEAVLEKLSDRQRQVAALHSHGHRRPEIAAHLGMTPRSVKRAIENILTVGRAELVRLAGSGCEAGEGLVARFAFGLATPRERGQAQLHLTTCPQCGALYERLGLWHDKVAALVPIPVVAEVHPSFVERAADVGLDRVAEVKRQVVEGGQHLKEHATTAYYRSVDPTPLAGARPGAIVATVASCVVVGGGAATYCVQQATSSAPPRRAEPVAQRQTPKPEKKRKKETPTPAPTQTMTVTGPAAQSPEKSPRHETRSTASSRGGQLSASPPPAPQDEYEPVTAASSSSSSTAASSAQAPREPAPAPSSGPGEFDGP